MSSTEAARDQWLLLRVDAPAALAEACANFLLEHGAPGLETRDADGSPDAPPAGMTRIDAPLPAAIHATVRDALAGYVTSLATLEPRAAEVVVGTFPVPTVDWDAVYRHHHRPLLVGTRLLVAPPWAVPTASDREILVIEPGMAFGTGQHATTRGCLEAIEAIVLAGRVARALDVGTGSGILALALVRLGVSRVVALDLDPAALSVARENFARNAAPRVGLVAGTAAAVRGPFDLVAANLLADAVVAEAEALGAAVAPRGNLVLSGLLDTQVPRVLAAYDGWRVVARHGAEGWATLTLVRAA